MRSQQYFIYLQIADKTTDKIYSKSLEKYWVYLFWKENLFYSSYHASFPHSINHGLKESIKF